ncbi:MAG: hypothetical protein KJ698_03860 [Actinobacteria bacterium]|jgi:hypothetical protein|nr:hypothetical protein [Actinomycetota bacterium]MBU1492991.1 hypothetical protein [Actinomycetota bacterium]
MLALNRMTGVAMPGRDEIRDAILGAADGARGSVEALAATGIPATVEDFDVEVQLAPRADGGTDLSAVVRFAIVVSQVAGSRRSVA